MFFFIYGWNNAVRPAKQVVAVTRPYCVKLVLM